MDWEVLALLAPDSWKSVRGQNVWQTSTLDQKGSKNYLIGLNSIQSCWNGSSWVEPDRVTCSRTQHSNGGVTVLSLGKTLFNKERPVST